MAAPPAKVIGSGGAIPKIGNNYDIPASLGVLKGGNLFQTFIQFDLTAGESATFGGTAGLENIFSRVTGSRSYIDGTIRSSSPGVNLYFLNANGITFGPHARLEVAGSFAVTTADVLKFDDGGRFNAIDPSGDSLTAGNLSAYGFLGTRTSSIGADYGQFPARPPGDTSRLDLTVPQGETLTVVGGSLDFGATAAGSTSPTFRAPGGRIEMAAVKKGDLGINFAPGPKLGRADFAKATIDSEGAGSRGLALRAGRLDFTNTNATTSGPVNVQVTGTAKLAASSKLVSLTSASAAGGNFKIRAGRVVLNNIALVGTQASGTTPAGSRAGNVFVDTKRLEIFADGRIESYTFGAANAGNVSVRADSIRLTGQSRAILPTGILSGSSRGSGVSGPVGRAGDVNVRALQLQIFDGAVISSDTFDSGHGGNVDVRANALSIGVTNFSTNKTGVFADSLGGTGNGGSIYVETDSLAISNGGLISTKTVGPGSGGETVVKAKSLLIDRGTSPYFTGIAADSATNAPAGTPAGPAGPGGNVRVDAEVARLTNGGQISATTETQGRGGQVTVTARDLMLDGHVGDAISSIASDSITTAGAGGDSGGVNVTADRLVISDGARISATTFGNGDAGAVRVTAGTALLSGTGTDFFTGITAATVSPNLSGAAGTVRTQFDSLVIRDNASIVGTTAGPGRGGDVSIVAGTARLLNGGQISADTSAVGRGGNVDVTAGLLNIDGSGGADRTGIFSDSSAVGRGGRAGSVRVTATAAQLLAGGSIAASSSSSGMGGSVVVAAQELKLAGGSSVAASATGRGDAGSVDLQVADPLEVRGLSSVRTTSAKSNAGTVSITSASDINIEDGSSVTVQALTGNAGRIALQTPHRLLVRNSTLLAEAGLNGGDIFIDPQYIVLDHSIISANAVNVGGNILLVADNFLPSSTSITATGSTAGTVQISAPQLDLSGALASLTAQLVDASLRFQERCAMRLGGEVSSFLVLGRGGVEDLPADPAIMLSRRKTLDGAGERTNGER